MSESIATRIPLEEARSAAAWLMQRWAMNPETCAIAGSVRRGRADIRDLDFIAPLPDDPARDQLYDAIAMGLGIVKGDDSLFEAPRPPQMTGRVINGLKPGFKGCALVLTGESGRQIPVNIGRYTAGARGNRGWTELRLTGPREFGKALLVQWKVACGTAGDETPGSDKGFLVDQFGRPQPTPTELHVFQLARCLMVNPQVRAERTLLWVLTYLTHHTCPSQENLHKSTLGT